MAAADELTTMVSDGIEASRAIENPAIAKAFEILRAMYADQAQACHHSDDLGRFRYMEARKMVTAVEQHLIAVSEGGKIAASKIAELNPPRGVIHKLTRGF